MIKRLSIVLVPLLFLTIVPVSIYAYSNIESVETSENGMNYESQSSEFTSYMIDAHKQHHQNWNLDSSVPNFMIDSEFMFDMMSSFDCFNEEEHDAYIEEQIKFINSQLENNLITSEEANQRLAQINEIQEFHLNNHQNMMDTTNSCHRYN